MNPALFRAQGTHCHWHQTCASFHPGASGERDEAIAKTVPNHVAYVGETRLRFMIGRSIQHSIAHHRVQKVKLVQRDLLLFSSMK